MSTAPRDAIPHHDGRRPNVLLILTDQLRFDALGCYGGLGVRTPNLDRLAAEGVRFSHCYVDSPICTPSRASLLTGKSVPDHGVGRLYDILPDGEVLLPERLRRAGYATALVGKLHVSAHRHEATDRHPHDGFDVYEWCPDPVLHLDSPFNGYRRWLTETNPRFLDRLRTEGRRVRHHPRDAHFTRWVAERTIELIGSADGAAPWFCLASFFDPHNPYDDHPIEMESLVDADGIAEPLLPAGELERRPAIVRYAAAHGASGSTDRLSRADLRAMRVGYLASVAFIDLEVGRILAALAERGIADDTLVIFTSDHGDMLGDHHLLTKGPFFYDPSVRVPLIARWPGGMKGGLTVSDIVQPSDLAATILAAAGCPTAETRVELPDARDLLPLGRGERGEGPDEAICCYRNSAIFDTKRYSPFPIHATMLREPRYKLNLYRDGRVVGGGIEGELYDMAADPDELRSLWDDDAHAGVRRRMTERLYGWLADQELRRGSPGGEYPPWTT